MARKFNPLRSPDITVTTTEQVISPIRTDQLYDMYVYGVNNGSNEVFFQVSGSHTGGVSGDRDGGGVEVPDAEINREWEEILTDSIEAGDGKRVDIPRVYAYIKITLWTTSGTSTFNYYLQQKQADR